MTVTAKNLVPAKTVEDTQTTQYIVSSNITATIIDKFTGYNGSGGAVTLTVKLVPASGSAAATNIVVSKAIAAGVTETFPVFPTSVGMNRHLGQRHRQQRRVPHERGDEPAHVRPLTNGQLCSPRAWG